LSASTAARRDGAKATRLAVHGPHAAGKLVVVISALNEAASIGSVVSAIPRRVPRVDSVEVIVVDDGSTDGTAQVALTAGADRVERHTGTRGLVAAFRTGAAAALDAGADVIVHLDGDGQHDPAYVPLVVAPITRGQADVVVGARPLGRTTSIAAVRRHGNRLGSWVLKRMLKVPISDATSGYRAFSRDALMRMNVVSEYTYTLETLIRAARTRLTVHEIAVPALPRAHGESRVTRSIARYVGHTGGQAFRILLHSNPLTLFIRVSLVFLLLSGAFSVWFLVAYQAGGLHLPILLGSLLTLVVSVGLFVSGLIADGVNTNLRLLEDALYRLRRIEHDLAAESATGDEIAPPLAAASRR
jgi:glycosyltransferase involved in cell wall biosynthesis